MKEVDLWIGDIILLKKSGNQGKYAGKTQDGKFKITLPNGKTILTTLSNMQLAPPVKEEVILHFDDMKVSNTNKFDQLRSIDLHIDKLAPHLERAKAERILRYQLDACKQFLDEAFHGGRKIVTIIHGKGEGVLRSEVQHLLKMNDRVGVMSEINDGGATEVWFK